MQQLLLDISTQKIPSFETFVTGKNEEPIQFLHRFARRESSEHFIYLWGDHAVGKTHLLKALAQYHPARYIDAASGNTNFLYDPQITLYLLDNCDKLSPEKQIDAFHLFNAVRENNAFLVTTGAIAPALLPVRDDLRSRMSWGLAYRIQGLTDEEKIEALKKMAQERGFTLAQDVLPYLITHYPRDMHSLSVVLDALDHYSMQTKRAITLPLLREMMQKIENNHE
ncbi:MAG: DnaA regulatory inactivator Hda [Betaproteobacteria bacterium]|nr:DnaA regulatory inactivator Hda [Betaproteobacteria bacterium]